MPSRSGSAAATASGSPGQRHHAQAGQAGRSGASGEPRQLDLNAGIVAQVPGVGDDGRGARDVGGQPIAVHGRDERVGPAVGEVHRDTDRADIEAPRLREGEVVIDPAVRARSEPVQQLVGDRVTVLRQLGEVGRGQLVAIAEDVDVPGGEAFERGRPLPLDDGPERRFPGEGGSNSSTLPAVIPASQSSPSAGYGAIDTSARQRRTRSPRSAAQASACGPPPEPPVTAKRPTPSCSAMATMSGPMSATLRPASRVDSP